MAIHSFIHFDLMCDEMIDILFTWLLIAVLLFYDLNMYIQLARQVEVTKRKLFDWCMINIDLVNIFCIMWLKYINLIS